MRILGIDPGEHTGFAVIEVSGEHVSVIDYGIVPVTERGRAGLVCSVRFWVTSLEGWFYKCENAVFSEIVQIPHAPTSHAAVEVQGILRSYGCIGYHPATIHSQLGTRKKADTKAFVQRVLGFKPTSIDHVCDAFAVALAHAIKVGAWSPHIDLRSQPAAVRQRGRVKEVDPSCMSPEELGQAINTGRVKIGKR